MVDKTVNATSTSMKINEPQVAVEISKEANKKILALVPQEWIERIPFFVRNHATTKTCARIAEQYPELYALASQPGDLPVEAREQVSKIVNGIFEAKMKKHNL
ncbi:hypothetical protein [Atopobium fossor]|uniref:hypothetical protein n=1 Tax=Atopobium fossor TaxID=39487 RepID=UPI0003F75ED5|nr:hypothetical protein [Atopobium fossor]